MIYIYIVVGHRPRIQETFKKDKTDKKPPRHLKFYTCQGGCCTTVS